MTVGARDYIDQMLVKKYAKEQANNLEDAQKLSITNERYWEIMKDVAQVQMAIIKVANLAKKTINNSGIQTIKNQA